MRRLHSTVQFNISIRVRNMIVSTLRRNEQLVRRADSILFNMIFELSGIIGSSGRNNPQYAITRPSVGAGILYGHDRLR